MAPTVKKANDLNGGGGYENWTLVQVLLTLTSAKDYDYLREAPFNLLRVDVAFNLGLITMQTPAILTEWKCNPNSNSLAMGCTADIDKFVKVLTDAPVGAVLPLPLVIGVDPKGAAFPGYQAYPIGDNQALFLYLSSAATWLMKGVLDKTWYSQQDAFAHGGPSLLPDAIQ